jgi:hypothetical protein
MRARSAFLMELERYSLADFAQRAPALVKLWGRLRRAAQPARAVS